MGTRSPWRRLRRVFRQDPAAEVDRELELHIEERVRDYVAGGMDRHAARRAALGRLGDLERVRSECTRLLEADRRAERRRVFIGVSWLDVKLGLRMLMKHPGLTLIGGFGLAVGTAISVGFATLLTAVVYPTLPLDDGDRVVALENRDIAINNAERRSLHDFFTWRDELESLEDLTAFRTVERNLITGDGPPELVGVAEMTASGFQLARVPPLLGRHLLPDDEREGAPLVLVIGYHVWQNRFAGDSAVIGRAVRLGRAVHTIVGVMPEGFAFPESHAFWAALRDRPSAYERREGPAIYIAGRLATGVTTEMAQAELSAIGQRTAAAFPETHELLRPRVMPYTHSLTGAQGVTIWMVIQMNLMVSLVLLAIALNVAVLIYARTAARHGEIAVRNALGASRGRVITQLFVEALVLSVGAAALGIALAKVGIGMATRAFMTSASESGVPFWADYGLGAGAILSTVAVAVLVAVITGVLPALQATGRRLQSDLRRLHGTGMRLGRTWTVLIAVQIAIAVAALPAAVNLGWNEIPSGLLTHLTFPTEEFAAASLVPEPALTGADAAVGRPAESVPFGVRLTELLRRLEAEPTVAGATFLAEDLPEGAIRGSPLAPLPVMVFSRVRVEGVPPQPEYPAGYPVASIGVHPNFPAVHDLRILSGRSLEPGDVGEAASAVIVTQAFVRDVLGGGDAIGRRFRHLSARELAGESVPIRWYEIVGVMEDLATNPVMTPMVASPAVYYPVGAEQVQQAQLRVRLRGSTPADFAPTFRQIAGGGGPVASARYGLVPGRH